MQLFDDAFQRVGEVHQQITVLKEDSKEENWFEEVGEKVFTF